MNRPELRRQLQALARHFQAQTGRVLTGQQVKQLLTEPGNHRKQAGKL